MENKNFVSSFEGEDYDWRYRYAGGGKHASKLHAHDFYEFFITLNPNVLHYVNGEVDLLPDATLVLIRPSDTHYFDYQGKVAPQHINLAFRASILDDLFDYLGEFGQELHHQLLDCPLPPSRTLSQRDRQRIVSEINQFNVIDPAQHQHLRQTLRFFVANAIFLLAKNAAEAQNDVTPLWLRQLCEEMREHENFSGGLERMVVLSGKSREHLSRSMKKYKNTTLTEYINSLRLSHAAKMLVNSNLKIIEICYDSGFTSLDYFGKLFRKRYGISPTKFREEIAKNV